MHIGNLGENVAIEEIPTKCPTCGSKNIENDYGNRWNCNAEDCEDYWDFSWTDSFDEKIVSLLGSEVGGGYSEYDMINTREINFNGNRCYFCNRTSKEWDEINNKIVNYLESEKKLLGDKKGTRNENLDLAVNSFKKIWSKVNGRHKVSTLMSDPLEFLPEEISKYWSDDWDDYSRYEMGASRGPFADYFENIKSDDGAIGADSNAWQYYHPEWFSLERLCLDWLYKHHTDVDLAPTRKDTPTRKNKDVRVKSIQKQMLNEITEIFIEELGSDKHTTSTVDEQLAVNNVLIERLSMLQNTKFGLNRFTWKPWSHEELGGSSSSRSNLLSIHTWICPMCEDRFQSQE